MLQVLGFGMKEFGIFFVGFLFSNCITGINIHTETNQPLILLVYMENEEVQCWGWSGKYTTDRGLQPYK